MREVGGFNTVVTVAKPLGDPSFLLFFAICDQSHATATEIVPEESPVRMQYC